MKELRKKVEEFDKILDKEGTSVIKDAVAKIKLSLKNKFNLERKEIEGDKKVSDTELTNLRSIIEK